MKQEMIERYRTPTRVLHWTIAASFTVLFVTGLVLYLSPLAFLAAGSWTRVIHRAAAVVFVLAPLAYVPFNLRATARGVGDACKWSATDMGWALAAPRYYFLCDEKAMPPQGHMNTGQKMWWLMVLVFGVAFIVSGAVMWFAKTVAPPALLQAAVFVHDISFVVTGAMFFVHIYLSVAHPLMRPVRSGAWSSMATGKVSAEYARTHHAAWYAELTGEQPGTPAESGDEPARVEKVAAR